MDTVAVAYAQPELALLLSRLHWHGIHTAAVGQGHVSLDWALTVALGGVRIRVPAEQAEEARALLAEVEPPRWRGGIFADNRVLDVALAVMLFLTAWVPPPARIPAAYWRGGCAGKDTSGD